MTESPEVQPKKKRPKWLIAIAAVVGFIVLLGIVGAIVGPQEEDGNDAAAATTPAPPATSAPATSAPAVATQATAAPPVTSRPAAALPASDPRCVAASEDYVIAVSNGLTDDTLTLQNAQMIVDGDLTFLGASTVRPDGEFENRSDVWVLSGMMPLASTGGARGTTEWPKASDVLQISPGDERVQAVDACVVNLTRN